MHDVVIDVENLGKKYAFGKHDSHSRFSEALTGLARKAWSAPLRWCKLAAYAPTENEKQKEFWALKEVSFQARQGEIVGIVGNNGAGKSTLLKILSRVTEQSTGRFGIRGRVGGLLEVGTGFHPELTGGENIYLSATLMGMNRARVRDKYEEIVDFAGTEKFLDVPVKRYSSGMYLRLAFAVAAHLDPDILIVDEVLAVGDASFQDKCMGRMKAISRADKTVLFVSHNLAAVADLCQRALLLDSGRIIREGSPKDILTSYLQGDRNLAHSRCWQDETLAPGNDQIRLRSIAVIADDSSDGLALTVKKRFRVDIEISSHLPTSTLSFSVVVNEFERGCIFNTTSDTFLAPTGSIHGTFFVPGDFLNDGVYSIHLKVLKDGSLPLIDLPSVLEFQVQDVTRTGNWFGKWPGAVRPQLEWRVALH